MQWIPPYGKQELRTLNPEINLTEYHYSFSFLMVDDLLPENESRNYE